MSYLWIHMGLLFPSEDCRNSVHISVIKSCHQDGVKSVQVASKIPETRLASKATIHQHVEAINAEECGISLTSREYVQCWVAESYVSNHI